MNSMLKVGFSKGKNPELRISAFILVFYCVGSLPACVTAQCTYLVPQRHC